MRPKLSIVIVSYNSARYLGPCIAAIEDTVRACPFEIVVVDNASSDDSAGSVERTHPAVKVVRMTTNVGFAKGINHGVRQTRGELVLLLNPDTVVGARAIEVLVQTLESDPRVGIVGARTRYADGTVNATCCFGAPSLWSSVCVATGLARLFRDSPWFNVEDIGGWARDTRRDVATLAGCCVLMRRTLWDRMSGFDERFFMYSEDVDLCARVRAVGLKCVLEPAADVMHFGGRSDIVPAAKMAKVLTARAQFMRKHWHWLRAGIGIALIDAMVATRRAVHAIAARLGRPASRERLAMWNAVAAERSRWHSVPGAQARLRLPRLRLAYRWTRFAVRSLATRDLDFVRNAIRSAATLCALAVRDVVPLPPRVECNICGWTGRGFYPNTGPGYDERDTLCPACHGLARHRDLLHLLRHETRFFAAPVRAVEVAPMRGFERVCRSVPNLEYTSFDLERHAMERGDITRMRYEDQSVDYFVCMHVLEHIPDEATSVAEIRRVLRTGGTAVLQVPVDWSLARTYEYEAPDPREVGHVRRYGEDFGERIARFGFDVRGVKSRVTARTEDAARFGLSDEPIFLAERI